ncbi:MAG: hypothetical protein KGQ49_02285 [Verrucomicrobia bacterium]|nr:hypothetical protein [Verrucomicrobiota bacterium]MBU6446209.1 hypothetical protein [Verrucomicrobiota bacterium]
MKTVPGVRRLNENLTEDVHQAYKGLFDAQRAAGNWQREAVKTMVITAIAVSLVVLAFLFHGVAGTILAGLGLAAVGFGIHSAYKAVVCYNKTDDNETIYEVAGGELLTKIFEEHEMETRAVSAVAARGPAAPSGSHDEV